MHILYVQVEAIVAEHPEKSRDLNWPQTHTDTHRHYWVKLEKAQGLKLRAKAPEVPVTELIGSF